MLFRSEGELSIARWRTRLKAGVENIKNYTYFNQQATPEQKSGSLQVLSASLNQDFKLGIFHLDNEMICAGKAFSVDAKYADIIILNPANRIAAKYNFNPAVAISRNCIFCSLLNMLTIGLAASRKNR